MQKSVQEQQVTTFVQKSNQAHQRLGVQQGSYRPRSQCISASSVFKDFQQAHLDVQVEGEDQCKDGHTLVVVRASHRPTGGSMRP